MSGLAVVDDHTFTVRLTEPFSLWPETLGYAAYAPLPRAFFDDHDAWLAKPIGNGPYKIDTYTKSQSMKLVKYEDYAGPDKAQNEGVELRVYTDNNTAYTDLQAGNLDVIDDVPASQLSNAEKDLGDRFINQPAGIIQTVSFPLYDPAWSSPEAAKVRQGLSMAIDREEITSKIYFDTRTPATDFTSPVLGDTGGYEEGLCGEFCTFDPSAPGSSSRRAAACPAARSPSARTWTPAPTASGWTPPATASTTCWTTPPPAPSTRCPPSPTSATRSPTGR